MDPLVPRPEPLADRGLRIVLERARWYGGRRLVALGVSATAVAGLGWWALHPAALPVETRIPVARRVVPSTTPRSVPQAPVTSASLMYVDVAGAVNQPGVYRIAHGARVVDVIERAGGASADAELDAVNLARLVDDGERVYVPRRGESDPIGTSTSDTLMVHINTATAQQLDALPGVGPATAAAIIAYRSAHGPFASLDELAAVKGIGPSKLDAIRPMIDL